MELQEAWEITNSYLEQIVSHTKDLRQKVEKTIEVSESASSRACVCVVIDIAEKEVAEALHLSQSAQQRLRNLHSQQRKGVQDGQSLRKPL